MQGRGGNAYKGDRRRDNPGVVHCHRVKDGKCFRRSQWWLQETEERGKWDY